MNIEQWEDRIIAFLEGDQNDSEKQEIINAAASNDEINALWLSYQGMYADIDAIEAEESCPQVQLNFEQFLQKEIDKQDATPDTGAKVITFTNWKKIMTIAAVTVGVLFMWNHNKHDEEMSHTLAEVSHQLERLQSQSSTEKIRAIRVNYDNQTPSADENTKQVLVNLLKNDPSSNVRLAAVEALENFTDDDQIRTALIKALTEEQDGFVKLALVKTLGAQFNNNIANTFEEIASDKTNEKFIRDEVEKELFKHNRIKS